MTSLSVALRATNRLRAMIERPPLLGNTKSGGEMGATNDNWEECDTLEFKDRFDPKNTGDWCELIKDIVALANSGGGRIVVGANDDGTPSGHNTSDFLGIDMADFMNAHSGDGGQSIRA